ncbi:caspase domain-containing protein [Hirsutella rhossiliensis]|uniref:Caspase domain-containing protein n=1 Tax=Hirsutella rhossiliensis TaxID=111463 RepID=A0A9P8N0N0_9HYPO|nr:caspase domain-containing protein [Hirsutella rhossiliensis]KAH0965978.1 caspase domain-containing protein [Hirsutella rhossiliensis]
MPDEPDVAASHWAILIGVNFYVGDTCLKGAVRDVEVAKQYLEAGPAPVDIAILTATTPGNPDARVPVEDPAFQPTRDNVIKKLERILRNAKEGDSDEKTESCLFNVTVNEHAEYEILDSEYQSIISLPAIPLEEPGASDRVANVLQHLATFKYLEGIENRHPDLAFEKSFLLVPINGDGAPEIFDVKHGGEWGFTIENLGETPLYLALFNFTPSWKIINLISGSGGGDFLVVQPKNDEAENSNKETLRFAMEVPEFLQSRGIKRCEDIVKVFITSKPTDFPSMVLPEIPLTGAIPNRAASGAKIPP